MYVKLFTSLYQGTLRGNSHGILVFTNLLAHADKGGIVDIHPRAIAEEVGLTRDQVQAAIDELEAPDPESRSPDEDGRRLVRVDAHRAWGWKIVNFLKYRAMRNEDERREQNRTNQASWRNKQSKPPSATVITSLSLSAHTEAEAEAYTETKEKTKTARKRAAPVALVEIESLVGDGLTQEVATAWMAHRKSRKAPLTPLAWAGVKAEADKAGWGYERAVLKAIARGWTGFEAAWVAGESAQRLPAQETAYQRSMRERIAEISPGLARRAPGAPPQTATEFFDVEAKRIG